MERTPLQQCYDTTDFDNLATQTLQALRKHLKETVTGETEKVISWNTPEQELEFWRSFLTQGSKTDFIPEVLRHTVHLHHPKYMGHQVAAPAPITGVTAMVSALLNNGMAIYEMGMAPSAIERVVIDSLCQTLGYDRNSGGFLTSGGSLANLTALLAARRTIVTHDVWNKGYNKPLGIMVCAEAHYCIDRAAKIMGLGERGIIKVPSQTDYSIDSSKLESCLERATAEGITVFAIVGSAPSTATGAYDNLAALGEFARKKGLWFHVDGAHGGAAIYSKKYQHLVQGIATADSVTIDGHKMLLMPAITTALLFKNRWHAQQTFDQRADYLLSDAQDDQWYQSGKKTFECTKTMMCLHWFVLLKWYGASIFDDFVTRQYDLTRIMANLLRNDPSFELAAAPQSNIVCFRLTERSKTQSELNTWNANVRYQLLEEGTFYIVQTKLRGKHYLRTSLMNPFTTKMHLKALLKQIKLTGQYAPA
ncbi:MAG: aminotransferase class I/II-fold pyridoxal phosphate-dependent enzyme [Bacteroidota bacterium]